MNPNRTIYIINHLPELVKTWRELSEAQKRRVVKECETAEAEDEVEKIVEEIADGQRRLF